MPPFFVTEFVGVTKQKKIEKMKTQKKKKKDKKSSLYFTHRVPVTLLLLHVSKVELLIEVCKKGSVIEKDTLMLKRRQSGEPLRVCRYTRDRERGEP